MKIYSWNVNGIRALQKKGFLNWIKRENPDILCIQETKAQEDQLDKKLIKIPPYYSYFISAEKKGYSGLALYSKEKPISVKNMDEPLFDSEGKFMEIEYKDFTLINCYFPNSQQKGKRIDYKMKFNDAVLDRCNNLVKNGKNIILCGDLNVAHNEIDLKNPKGNTKNPGYLPEEREWMSKLLASGYIDVFRYFYPETVKYSWWSYRFNSREKNSGWRIDYHIVNKSFIKNVKNIEILDDILGSDHCPVMIEI